MAYPDILNTFVTLLLVGAACPPIILALVPRATRGEGHATLRPARNQYGRIAVFDTMRGIAILGVVLIHVLYLMPTNTYGPRMGDGFDVVNALLRFALPVFFITSGILLTPPAFTFRALMVWYGRHVVRLMVPYLFVLSILLMVRGTFDGGSFLRVAITGSASVPYYFIVVLLQCYLIYPGIAELARKRWFVYVSLGLSLLSLSLPFSWAVWGITLVVPYLFYFVWGIYMRQQMLEGAMPRVSWPWVVMVGVSALAYIQFPGPYYNTQYFYSVSVFVLLYFWLQQIGSTGRNWFSVIGRMSMWVYLVHFPLMELVLPQVFVSTTHGVRALVYASAVSLVMSAVAAYVCDRGYRALVRLVTYRKKASS